LEGSSKGTRVLVKVSLIGFIADRRIYPVMDFTKIWNRKRGASKWTQKHFKKFGAIRTACEYGRMLRLLNFYSPRMSRTKSMMSLGMIE